MRAAQFPHAGGAIEMTTKPVPAPRAGEVRLRVEACGICAGDLHVQQNSFPGIQFSRVPGHEIAGTVDALVRLGSGSRWRGEKRTFKFPRKSLQRLSCGGVKTTSSWMFPICVKGLKT